MDEANIPRTWLMTDERMGSRLFDAIARLPTRSGVVFRHHSLVAAERMLLGERVVAASRRGGHLVAVSRDLAMATVLGADLLHNPGAGPVGFPSSFAVHDLASANAANSGGAALAFLSPIFATRSHPNSRALPRNEVRLLVDALDCPVIALGGMNAARFAEVEDLGFHGWAGIDAWL